MSEPQVALEDVAPILPVSSRDRPDAKTQRYDRQLRLWASSGQAALERASLVIGPATATSAQILKNLVLPGIGSFSLYDSQSVSESDLGHNFFLEESSSGKNRAQEVSRLLAELNPDVKTNGIEDDLMSFVRQKVEGSEETTFHSSSIAIGVGLEDNDENELAEKCWENNIPLILVQTCGFLGSIRVQVKELGLIETHPDSYVDLRLDSPFPTLLEFVKSFDFQKLDTHEHTHIPAVVIMIHFLELFKSTHDGKLPKTSAEREELKKMIQAEKRNADEDNFDEAVGMIWKACRPTRVPDSIQSLFLDPCCTTLSPNSTPFWILVRTLREFVHRKQNDGSLLLPLTGVLPDMKADTNSYVKLQTIYRQKAQQDLLDFKNILKEILDQHSQIIPSINHENFSDEVLHSFVKHSAFLKLIRGRSLAQERSGPEGLISLLTAESEPSAEQIPASWYLALRASALFRQKHHRYPGSIASEIKSDQTLMETIANEYLGSLGGLKLSEPGLPKTLIDAIGEVVRAGGSELPQIAALIGGIVAQEAIKLISHQYIPLSGTCIFDGIKSSTSILHL
ncbi:uncharacterized protein MELLADRAFT_91342 [Melampsora larici-populina 98AG31]|uniref:NEDD8-activating enzyme E1 regulatory subunit n=1 Tax=Melampsora larici-populina (strain 98AG31 / pathotype 3-4-7) TaxID=747676 RepID=F4RYQ0_MELLP|nr:uncharacterized protein MELLADRAFT_91342 [Melampsora larici-populina 98AG31]EGG02509.1 hypothetical protein MELLADRAFT_91342 [Melampsora larici-populina 98AG31]